MLVINTITSNTALHWKFSQWTSAIWTELDSINEYMVRHAYRIVNWAAGYLSKAAVECAGSIVTDNIEQWDGLKAITISDCRVC
ncbi:hypothetical protein SUGI_0036850 [Cryptomeria japonica]|nr:hypothetical protein SUGI_0036850 [Cryptomeria japonica]